MSELIEIYGHGLNQIESQQQDQQTEKFIKNLSILVLFSVGVILVLPYITHAQTTNKKILTEPEFLEYNGTQFRKLFTQIDYRQKKKSKKNY